MIHLSRMRFLFNTLSRISRVRSHWSLSTRCSAEIRVIEKNPCIEVPKPDSSTRLRLANRFLDKKKFNSQTAFKFFPKSFCIVYSIQNLDKKVRERSGFYFNCNLFKCKIFSAVINKEQLISWTFIVYILLSFENFQAIYNK